MGSTEAALLSVELRVGSIELDVVSVEFTGSSVAKVIG
jgi:hypothetical protein